MSGNPLLEKYIRNDSRYVSLENGICSFIPKQEQHHAYDSKVGFYDTVVGSVFWNRFIWKNEPSAYDSFCAQTLHDINGPVLDVGCGSLVFTEQAYSRIGERELILVDRSLGMLSKARARLEKRIGAIPDNIAFVQADLFHLPFKQGMFEVVNAFGMVHVFEDTGCFLDSLNRVRKEEGCLNMLSLVSNDLLSGKVMGLLKRKGELAHILNSEELKKSLNRHQQRCHIATVGNISYIICK